jgi:hypothetical protein
MASPVNIKIHKLWINHAGAYTDQYTRPYETFADGATIRDIENCIHGYNGQRNHGLVSGQMLGGVATAFCKPQAAPGELVGIVNGWETPRMTFMMEVEIMKGVGPDAGSITELILGYSNYNDPSYSGRIDPNTTFYINSITKLRQVKAHTPFGWQTQQNVVDSSHVIVNRDWTEGGLGSWMSQNKDVPTNMRPQDLYSSLSVPDVVKVQNDFHDFRNTRNSLPVFSRRANNLSTDYIGKVMQGYQSASSYPSSVGEDVYSAAIGHIQESLISRDEFIRVLDNMTGTSQSSSFTFRDLLRMDNTVMDRLTVVQPENLATGPIDYRNYSQVMTGQDMTTQAAAILFNGIPALMAGYGVTALAFQATNSDYEGPKLTFTRLKGFGGLDMTPYAINLQTRIQKELIDFISQNNCVEYFISARCLFSHDMHLEISINGSAHIPFTAPTFADAMMSPILANNMTRLTEVANDFDLLVNQVLTVTPSLENISASDFI